MSLAFVASRNPSIGMWSVGSVNPYVPSAAVVVEVSAVVSSVLRYAAIATFAAKAVPPTVRCVAVPETAIIAGTLDGASGLASISAAVSTAASTVGSEGWPGSLLQAEKRKIRLAELIRMAPPSAWRDVSIACARHDVLG